MKLIRQIWKKDRTKRPAIFLDRDGTLIRHREVVTKESQMKPLPYVANGLNQLQDLGYLLIIISNQPNIEKGIVSLAETKTHNEALCSFLKSKGVLLNAIYFCPHRYGSKCMCRKPDLGLIRAAKKDFNIDTRKSWFIGDTTRDMETGHRAKLRTIHIPTKKENDDNKFFETKGDFVRKDIRAAAAIILKQES